MIKHLLLVWFVVAVAIGITAGLVPSVEIDGASSPSSALPCSLASSTD